jgi:hypothetical protein
MTIDSRERLELLLGDVEEAIGWNHWHSAKARDSREPGRRRKAAAEAKLFRLARRYLSGQRARLGRHFRAFLPGKSRGAGIEPDAVIKGIPASVFEDEILRARLTELFTALSVDGVSLFAESIPFDIDWALANTRAAAFARTYTTEWLRGLDDVTVGAIREGVAAFVEQPGTTLGDLMRRLPFDEARAQRIAVTEVTRVYAGAAQVAGNELKREFPGVRVVKQWFTNNDDLVCPICAPLNGMIVSIDGGFTTESGEDALGIPYPPAHVNCRCWIDSRADSLG